MTHTTPRAGFTLIEIIVVMAIIGILSAMVGGSFITSRVRARDAERKNAVTQMQRALELYYTDFDEYPPAVGGEIDDNAWGTAFTNPNSGTVYMTQLPSDSRAPTQQFYYESNATGTAYRLYARLENDEDSDTDLDGDGTPGDSYDGTQGDGLVKMCGTLVCNYGLSSPSTTMEEVW